MTPVAMAQIHAAANPAEAAWSEHSIQTLLENPNVFALSNKHCFCIGRAVAGEAEVLTIATHPDHQGKGQATALMQAFEAEAIARNASVAFLEVAKDNTAARVLYSRCGYASISQRKGYYRRQNGQSVDAVLMSKVLTKG